MCTKVHQASAKEIYRAKREVHNNKVGLIKLSCVLIKKRTFLLSRRVNDEDWESVDD